MREVNKLVTVVYLVLIRLDTVPNIGMAVISFTIPPLFIYT